MQNLFGIHVLAKPPEKLKVNRGHRTLFADAETEIVEACIGLRGVHGVHIRRQTLGLGLGFSHWCTYSVFESHGERPIDAKKLT